MRIKYTDESKYRETLRSFPLKSFAYLTQNRSHILTHPLFCKCDLKGYSPVLTFDIIRIPCWAKGVEKGKEHGGRWTEIDVWGFSPSFFVWDTLVALVGVGKKHFLKPKKSKIPTATKHHLSTGWRPSSALSYAYTSLPDVNLSWTDTPRHFNLTPLRPTWLQQWLSDW